MRKLDEDKSGLISFDEFFNWWKSHDRFKALNVGDNPAIKKGIEYFKKYDADRTGKINKEGILSFPYFFFKL